MARNVEVFRIAAKGTAEEVRKTLVATAKREHARIMTADPRPERFMRSVDGVTGAIEEKVKSGGIIRYHYQRLEQVIQFAMEKLFDLSPVLSGEYRNAHTLFVDGAAASNLAAWDGQSEIVIMNPLPYSRKIELGVMKMRIDGTSQVYEQAVSATNRRFGNQARALFAFRGYVGGGAVNPSTAAPTITTRTIVRGDRGRFGAGTRTVRVSGGEHNMSRNRFPAMLIVPRR